MSKAERTRALIIEKTAPIFNRKGFAGTSLADISAVTGLSKGSIYSNFASKDEVALAVFDYNLGMLRGIIGTEMQKHGSSRQRLLVYADVYRDFLKHPFLNAGCPIQNTATEADDTHPALRKKATDAIVAWKNDIARMIQKGMDDGEFNVATDPHQVAFTIIALIEGGILISKLTGKEQDQNAIRRSLQKTISELK